MGPGLPHFSGQDRVEQQHALRRPIVKVRRTVQRHAQVVCPFLEHVPQRRRPRQQRVGHAEREAVSLTQAVVGVLTQQHHLHVSGCRGLEGRPHVAQLRTQGVARSRPQNAVHECDRHARTLALFAPIGQKGLPFFRRFRPSGTGGGHAVGNGVVENPTWDSLAFALHGPI